MGIHIYAFKLEKQQDLTLLHCFWPKKSEIPKKKTRLTILVRPCKTSRPFALVSMVGTVMTVISVGLIGISSFSLEYLTLLLKFSVHN